MKSTDIFLSGKRKMVKIILIAFLSICPSLLNFGNPIMPPSIIMEIYFGTSTWELEVMNNEYFSEYENMDDLWLVGQYDTAQFEPGHPFLPDQLNVVTNYSMLTPMTIEQSGDYIQLCSKSGDTFYPLDGIAWGISEWGITAPVGEQSIARQKFTFYESPWYEYWDAKEQPNTINSSPGHVIKRTAFSGYVRDKENQPMADIYLDYCYDLAYYHNSNPTVPIVSTNSEGYFNTNNMYCKKYYVYFRIGEFYGPIIGDTMINLEPDSTNYFEFKLDTLLTGVDEIKSLIPEYSITNIPNPSSSQTKFIFNSTGMIRGSRGVIKIYNESGFIVDIVPVVINNESEEVAYNINGKSLLPGTYIYNLEIRNHKLASGKMLISR
jgi:hypothetical protein